METVITATAINYCDVFEKLRAACDILDWDNKTQNWKSSDGKWYSFSAKNLEILERSLNILAELCKIAFDIQYLIANKCLDFVKDILSHPEPFLMENRISTNAWQLMFNLVAGHKENQNKIWKECDQLFLNCLQGNSRHKDTCRFIVFQTYALGHLGQNEGIEILKILLKSFNDESEAIESNKLGLNKLLEYFVCDEICIASMYLKLNTKEKIWMLHFTNLCLQKGQTNVLPVSIDLICQICEQLKSKEERNFKLSITDNSELQEILALFRVIATASKEEYYGLNRFSFECFKLILRIGSIFKIVTSYGKACEKTFMDVSKDPECSLKLLLLTTISNIVKGNSINREKARESGLIESLVDFIVEEGTDPILYKYTVYALIDICYNNTHNKQFVGQLVSNRQHLQSKMLEFLLFDLDYNREK